MNFFQRAPGHQPELALQRSIGLCGLAARAAAVIRIDAVWLAVRPVDMRAGAVRRAFGSHLVS